MGGLSSGEVGGRATHQYPPRELAGRQGYRGRERVGEEGKEEKGGGRKGRKRELVKKKVRESSSVTVFTRNSPTCRELSKSPQQFFFRLGCRREAALGRVAERTTLTWWWG